MKYHEITEQYYSKWIGTNMNMPSLSSIVTIKTNERNKKQPGFPNPYDLYVLKQDSRIFISYGDKLVGKIDDLVSEISDEPDIEHLSQGIKAVIGAELGRNIKFVFQGLMEHKSHARALDYADYSLYLEFFQANNEICDEPDWLQDYFNGMVAMGYCFGIMDDGRIVSATDAPTMPYMQDRVQEIGINTRMEYRGKGYAKDVCSACISNMLSKGICPMWSAGITNIDSQRLAYSLGFEKFADVLTVSL